jgi:hypothetical protein
MKRTGICPKCDGRRIMRIYSLPDVTDNVSEVEQLVHRRLLVLRNKTTGLFGGEKEGRQLAGEVMAYACADCGYVEEYLLNPAKIDWDQVVGAVPYTPKTGGGGPFR